MVNQCLKIIFNLKNRKKFVERYLNIISEYQNYNNFLNILIINEENNPQIKINSKNKFKIINYNSKRLVYGMNNIFKSLYDVSKIIKEFKYVCFVEDDNFIFPKALIKCKNFLDTNSNYIACTGKSFLFSNVNKKQFEYLISYTSPNTVNSDELNDRFICYNGALCYYSLFKSEYFIKILEKINLINDDNMSEVFFNYMTLKIGKIKQLNNLYLAREYPRPQIYNIPDKITWLKNTNLLLDINIVINNIIKGCENYNEILNNSIFRYLSLRILNRNNKFILNISFYKIKKFFFLISNYKEIRFFIKILNEQ